MKSTSAIPRDSDHGRSYGLDMTYIVLTGADLADLAAGLRFNTLDANGEEVIVDGSDFSTDEIKALSEGGKVEWDAGDDVYTVTAPEESWAGHRSPEEMQALQEERGEPAGA
jgi:cold shock CspA family protein